MVASVQFHAFRRSSETFGEIAARLCSTLSPHPRAAHLRERCHSPNAIEILMFHFHAWSSPRLMAKLPWPLCILCAKLNSPSPFRLWQARAFSSSPVSARHSKTGALARANIHVNTRGHTQTGTGATKLPLFSKPNLFLPISVWWMAFYCHAMATDWKISSLLPRFCVCTNICPGFNQKASTRAVVQSDGIGKKFAWIGKKNDDSEKVKERDRARPWFQLRIFSFFLEFGFFSHRKHNRSSMDTISPVASRFLSALMFSRSDYLVLYREQTNEKRIKRYLHHTLHPPQKCLPVILAAAESFQFISLPCTGADSCRRGSQGMEPARCCEQAHISPTSSWWKCQSNRYMWMMYGLKQVRGVTR